MNWYIGCSGFHYREWRGMFYPEKMPQRLWFEYYSSRFHTLELNVTFYRFPQLSFLQNWYQKSPHDFQFAVKVPRLITHYKQFNETQGMLNDFYTTVKEGLQEKLGAVLFQLSPRYAFSDERLQALINSMDPGVDNVIEFRHESWWQDKVKEELTRHNISFCGISYPGLPEEIVINTQLVYYRFHGLEKLYYSGYTAQALKSVADTIRSSKKGKKVFILFNNTASGAAIENATTLESFITGKNPAKVKTMV